MKKEKSAREKSDGRTGVIGFSALVIHIVKKNEKYVYLGKGEILCLFVLPYSEESARRKSNLTLAKLHKEREQFLKYSIKIVNY